MRSGILFVLSCVVACGPDAMESGPVVAASPDTSGAPEPGPDVSAPLGFCEPGTFLGCSTDHRAVTLCADDGARGETRECQDDRGNASRCEDGVGCLSCIPATTRCRDDDRVEICQEDGSGYIAGQACTAEGTSQVCYRGSCVEMCEIAEKENSYMGCDYWAVDLDNAFVPGGPAGYYDAAGATFGVVVSNTSATRTAIIGVADSDGPVKFGPHQEPLDLSPLPPLGVRTWPLPRRDVDGTVLGPLAYHVTSSIPVSVVQFNPLTDEKVYSNDASLLLPTTVLDRWYIVMTRQEVHETLRSYLTVVAVSTNPTEVAVTVTARTLAGPGIPALEPGDTITRTLNQYDVLNIETNASGADLTGSVVLSSNRVAVFGGSEASNVPFTTGCEHADGEPGVCAYDGVTPCSDDYECLGFVVCCADHLEAQLFPVRTWGTHYMAARTAPRGGEGEVWRLLAANDGTVVSLVPPVAIVPVLNAGEHFELEAAGDFEIVATKPILVGQFLESVLAPDPGWQAGDAHIGDPAFSLVVPVEQYRTEYVFLAAPLFDGSFVTVTIATGAEVILDGLVISDDAVPIGVGAHGKVTIPIAAGAHVMTGDSPFGITVYGFGDDVSYAYPGGLDLKDLKHDKLAPPADGTGP